MSEPGLVAVRKEFGDEMVERIRNWPESARRWCWLYEVDAETTEKYVKDRERALVRAKHDPEFALDQARMVARSNTPDLATCDMESMWRELKGKDARSREYARIYREEHAPKPKPTVEPDPVEVETKRAKAQELVEAVDA